MPEIANLIRRLRFDHDEMTQEELARRVGVTRQTIIALEAGKYTPSLALAFRIARAFNRRVEDVFRYEVGVKDDCTKDGEVAGIDARWP
jgi:putative transcriptional regulator